MPAAARQTDESFCPSDSHGNDCCPHAVRGPAVDGSPNVYVNGLAALRVGDNGVHVNCCGSNTWRATRGSATVRVNGIPAVRAGDSTLHCGGTGTMVSGSPNVFIG